MSNRFFKENIPNHSPSVRKLRTRRIMTTGITETVQSKKISKQQEVTETYEDFFDEKSLKKIRHYIKSCRFYNIIISKMSLNMKRVKMKIVKLNTSRSQTFKSQA